jgi:ribosome-binding protein aMBF1 (putative translation factor)
LATAIGFTRIEDEVMATQIKRRKASRKRATLPLMPPADADGHYPAAETLQVIIARQITGRRRQAGWSQAELAKRAGIRPATVVRLESGKHPPNVRTVEKIDRALAEAEE